MAQPGDVIEHPSLGARMTFLKTSAQTNGELLRVEVVLPPGFSMAEHVHPRQEERHQILSGTLRARVDGQERDYKAEERVVGRYSGGKPGRTYLLRGLLHCEHCRTVYVGSSTTNAAKKRYSYYQCHGRLRAYQDKRKAGPGYPAVQARWLEELVWADVRRFLHDPGEVLERLREQQAQNRQSDDLEARRNSLAKRLAAKQAEKDRFVRLYARGKILDEEELETYLANVVNQVENLKQLISSVEADLARAEEDSEVAASAEAWLLTLRENLQEVEADTQEAFDKRRELVRLLVDRIAVSRTEEGRPRLDITYRFGPPTAESAGECVDGIRNSGRLTGEMYFGA